MQKLYCLAITCFLGITSISFAKVESPFIQNSEYEVAVFVWGSSDTPLAHEITKRLRRLGFKVPDPTMHKTSRYRNYTDRVEVLYTKRGQDKLQLVLNELDKIPGLTVETRLFTNQEDKAFSLAGDIQIQFPVILP